MTQNTTNKPQTPLSTIKYPSINGLRAISILLVICHHLSIKENQIIDIKIYKCFLPFYDFITDGHLGVNIFFVISGFLISTLLIREESQWKTISLKNFYFRRILRIFPAFYFLLLVYFFLQVWGYLSITFQSWLTAITFTKYFNWNAEWFTAHIWSLSIEENFYLFWPLIFTGGIKFRKFFAFAICIMVPIIRTYLYFHPITWMNELTLFTRIDSIATGCLFALYREEILKILVLYWKSIFYFAMVSLFFLRYFAIAADKMHLAFFFIPLGLTHGTIANLLIGLLLMYSIFGPRNIWFRFLNSKIINYIGMLSFSLYLWQQVFISDLKYYITQFPQNLGFMFLMSLISFYFIERPCLKYRRNLNRGKQIK